MTENKQEVILISIPTAYKKRLKTIAIEEGKTVAKLIREWVDKYDKARRFTGEYDAGVKK